MVECLVGGLVGWAEMVKSAAGLVGLKLGGAVGRRQWWICCLVYGTEEGNQKKIKKKKGRVGFWSI